MKSHQAPQYFIIKHYQNDDEISEQKMKHADQVIDYLIKNIKEYSSRQQFQIRISKGTYPNKEINDHQQDEQEQSQINDQNYYNIDLLKEQLLLFDNQHEIVNYIQAQKILANDATKQLTSLCFSLIQINKQLISQRKPLINLNIKDINYSKDQLDKFQSECMSTLIRIKQQRRRIENCCICLTSKSNMILMPCMHYVLCSQCVNEYLKKCPICQQPIKDIREVYQ